MGAETHPGGQLRELWRSAEPVRDALRRLRTDGSQEHSAEERGKALAQRETRPAAKVGYGVRGHGFNLKQIERLTVRDAGQKFTGEDFRDLRRPGVYVFMLAGEPLYIGMSSSLLGRIGGAHHFQQVAIEECDEVLLYPCANIKAADVLEEILIQRLKPKYNVRRRYGMLKNWLGIGKDRAKVIEKENAVSYASETGNPPSAPSSNS
jgi:hypothetical protein